MPPVSRPPHPDAPAVAHLGWALRVRRQQQPLKREQVAEALGYSIDVVKNVENGTYRANVDHYLAAWARVYGLDEELRDLWARVQEARAAEVDYAERRLELSTQVPERELVMAAAHESGDHAAFIDGAGIRPVAIGQLGEEAIRIARAYPTAAPFGLFADMVLVRNRVYWLLDHTRRLDQQRDLYLIASQVCGLLADASFDLGHPEAGAEQARSAHTYATMIGHTELQAWADGTLATIEFWSGRAERAVSLIERGMSYAPAGIPTVRLLCIGGRATAHMGDAERTRTAISAANQASEDADGASDLHDRIGGQFGFGQARQAFSNGSAYLRIGDLADARQQCETAIAIYDNSPEQRGHGADSARVDLASTRLLSGDLAGAEDALTDVLTIEPGKRIATLVERLKAVRGTLATAPFRGAREASPLDERIQAFVAEPAQRALPQLPAPGT